MIVVTNEQDKLIDKEFEPGENVHVHVTVSLRKFRCYNFTYCMLEIVDLRPVHQLRRICHQQNELLLT